ncbi:MAG: hypothetical protein WBM56_06930, partial [Robiginitalea sp.]|uniref:hypothetical protein n=1 Tax=Robiginitalea sp. TaxID=1902411 RepID=UPI003C752A36
AKPALRFRIRKTGSRRLSKSLCGKNKLPNTKRQKEIRKASKRYFWKKFTSAILLVVKRYRKKSIRDFRGRHVRIRTQNS